ncbi:MAG: threonylcarbamoyl-AMP synthase [Lachnospiraceae bacterium]|nr:threonylcarbamoyl-AMP synthase [Lachnospiraceae bacterium]
MKTIYIRSDADTPNEEAIRQAGGIIRAGGLVAFPTETVYGLGGDALNKESSRKIYEAKGRPSDNPLIVHICRFSDMEKIVERIPQAARDLAEAFWPGPLTMILPKSDVVPYETTGGLDTVAVRFPSHKTARAFIEAAGGYVAAPSANRSGRPSPTTANYVAEDMDGRIDMIIDGGEVGIGLESTIVDLTGEVPMILRPGYITQEMLQNVLGEIAADKTMLGEADGARPKAPGMKYRHYAPKGVLTIVEGNRDAVTQKINELAAQASAAGERVGVIATQETVNAYHADCVKNIGPRADEAAIAHNLYAVLREFDDEELTVLFSEAFDTAGMGQAIMNRLLKAAGHRVLRV